MAGNQKGPLDPKRFDHGERRKQYLRTPATSKKLASEPFSNSLLGPKGSLPELPIRSPTSCKVNQPFTQVQRLFENFRNFSEPLHEPRNSPPGIPRPESKGWFHPGAGDFLERSDFFWGAEKGKEKTISRRDAEPQS